jgi:Lipopolysaccharide kinase (Kdo/WaaP) family
VPSLTSLMPAREDHPEATTQPESFWRRFFRTVRRLRVGHDWERFAGPGWVDRIMHIPVTDRFHAKQGRSVGRLRLPAISGSSSDQMTVYLKRHHKLPWWRGLLATLFPAVGWSPAFQEWDHLEWARQQGVPVPRVVAAGEFIGPHGRLQSFLAVEELTDMLPLHEAIPLASESLAPDVFRRWKRALVTELARLVRLIHDRRTFHKDLYLCHFYIARGDTQRQSEWRGRVHLIDLHRLTHHAWTWRWWQVKDLAQLLFSTEIKGINDRDRLAFWRDYRGPGPWREAQNWLRGAVLFKWRRYRRHNARHPETRPVSTEIRGQQSGL